MANSILPDTIAERYAAVLVALEEAKMRCNSAPDGTIHIVNNGKNHTRTQYYLRTKTSDKSGKYLKKGNDILIQQLIQKEYDKKLIKQLEKEEHALARIKKHYEENSLVQTYAQMSDEKKKWLTPIADTTEHFLEKWNAFFYEAVDYKEEHNIYVTRRNEKVRSKSEVIIANLLDEYDVPYRYECPLKDENGIWAIPDFTVLNVKKRKEYYWEHLGKLEDSTYAKSAIKKIAKYEQHGYFQGDSLLLSYESCGCPLDIKRVEDLIRHFLLA